MRTRNEERIPLMGAELTPLLEGVGSGAGVEVFRLDLRDGARSPRHSLRSWKVFVVTGGVVSIAQGPSEATHAAGAVVFVPGGTPHSYRNDSGDPASLVVITSGVSQLAFLRGISAMAAAGPLDPDRLREHAAAHGAHIEGASEGAGHVPDRS